MSNTVDKVIANLQKTIDNLRLIAEKNDDKIDVADRVIFQAENKRRDLVTEKQRATTIADNITKLLT